uniref:Uncharacterized protein n=1 Tax=virus sp. ctE0n6 TaxID=2827985 RepID=A0A8S5RFX2_9VIRU|nr:MAG TPA: hypothetical protein [virus sp. ctE0n6]
MANFKVLIQNKVRIDPLAFNCIKYLIIPLLYLFVYDLKFLVKF